MLDFSSGDKSVTMETTFIYVSYNLAASVVFITTVPVKVWMLCWLLWIL